MHRVVITQALPGLNVGDIIEPVMTYGNKQDLFYFIGSERLPLVAGHYEHYLPTIEEVMAQPVVYKSEGDYVEQLQAMFETEFGYRSLDWEHYKDWELRIVVHYFEHHLCSDTYVGHGVIKIDGVAVAIVSQTGRKNPTNIYFLNEEARLIAKAFIHDILTSDDEEDKNLLPKDIGYMFFKGSL